MRPFWTRSQANA